MEKIKLIKKMKTLNDLVLQLKLLQQEFPNMEITVSGCFYDCPFEEVDLAVYKDIERNIFYLYFE